MESCEIINLGRLDYEKTWAFQTHLVSQVYNQARPAALIIVEHPHVYTMGRSATWDDVLLTSEELISIGIPVHEVDRGGQVTYHGPGQLVVYPIINLRKNYGPVMYVRTLEQVIIDTLKEYSISSHTVNGVTGVWVGAHKIGAIGVKISRGVAHHGLSLNVNTNLDLYRYIQPCGIRSDEITSMNRIKGYEIDLASVSYVLQYHFGQQMGLHMVELTHTPVWPTGPETQPTTT